MAIPYPTWIYPQDSGTGPLEGWSMKQALFHKPYQNCKQNAETELTGREGRLRRRGEIEPRTCVWRQCAYACRESPAGQSNDPTDGSAREVIWQGVSSARATGNLRLIEVSLNLNRPRCLLYHTQHRPRDWIPYCSEGPPDSSCVAILWSTPQVLFHP